MEQQELFKNAELAEIVKHPLIEFPYIIRAYRTSGKLGWWKIFPEQYVTPDCDKINMKKLELIDNGWQFIEIIKLPE